MGSYPTISWSKLYATILKEGFRMRALAQPSEAMIGMPLVDKWKSNILGIIVR